MKGKINVVPEMNDVMYARHSAIMGGKPCTDDKEVLKKVRDKLVEAKPKWMAMDYGNIEKIRQGRHVGRRQLERLDLPHARLQNPDISLWLSRRKAIRIWMDSVAVLKDAKNVENAKLFQNFIMDPENAAMISAFARYANGIKGSEPFMPADMKDAPEIVIPRRVQGGGHVQHACPPEVNEIYTKIWTELLK